MTHTLDDVSPVRIHVTAAAPAAPLAILSIAGILGIEPQQAADRLASLPTVLAENVHPPVARRLSVLLRAIGMEVRLDPALSPETGAGVLDASLRTHETPDAALVGKLARHLGRDTDGIAGALLQPGGLVLPGLGPDKVEALRRFVRRQPALRLALSAAPTATYDAFRIGETPAPTAEITRLGLGACRLTGAIAAEMNGATAACLARRTGGRLLILDRAFQRFDLRLEAVSGTAGADVERFLASRPTARIGKDGRRLLDADLPRRAALQFLADYGAIGVHVRLVLRGTAA